jgi:hypothetical protein
MVVFSPRLRLWWRIMLVLGSVTVVLFGLGIATATTALADTVIAIDWALFSVLFIGVIVGLVWTLCRLISMAMRATRG